ncbi:hypothetical protein TD95_000486 [Thielaviopsis punctulata]|uniref:Fungal lipase-type domain-containing protein n=1 Tax=Thielaviopsis punctulata TaxID=72032 RepID=A0A0F4ZC02_9PEZI|nr:hypothetical protein TD95_000486 [Thielaviopsis punctulata]
MLARLLFLVPAVAGFSVPRQTGCTGSTLPTDFTVFDFQSKSSNNGTTLSEFSFEYVPYASTGKSLAPITCSFNSSSVPVHQEGRSDRWACDDSLAQFIYESDSLTMIQKTCIQNGSMKRSLFLTGLLPAFLGLSWAANHRLDDPQIPITPHHDPIDSTSIKQISPVSAELFVSLERMARLVDISYCVGTTGVSKPFTCASRCRDFPTMELVKTWNTGIMMSDSCGYIAVDHGFHKGIILAFRGTYSVTNTVVDLTTVPQAYTPYPVPDDGDDSEAHEYECKNCTVHMGFYSSWINARDIVIPQLKALREKYPSYTIHLVGHSLGGAVATLAALELKVGLGWDNLVITTFGEPRIGNDGVADFVDQVFDLNGADFEDSAPEKQMFRRVTHIDDPVPLLPPSQWNYRSHSGELFITKPDLYPDLSDIRICKGPNDPLCSTGDDETESALFALSKLERSGNDLFSAFKDARSWVKSNQHKLKTIGLGIPKLWELFFAHRDYFWRLGLCVPGGDPKNWEKKQYDIGEVNDEL